MLSQQLATSNKKGLNLTCSLHVCPIVVDKLLLFPLSQADTPFIQNSRHPEEANGLSM